MRLNMTWLMALALAQAGGAGAAQLTVTSTAMKAGAEMPLAQVNNTTGCNGGNVSPDLKWSGAPKDTKAFAVTLYDPDGSGGRGWLHWLVVNIPPNVTSLAAGAGSAQGNLPAGASQGRNDYGKTEYMGPCPPAGSKHRYQLQVYALREKIPVQANFGGKPALSLIDHASLAKGSVEATYSRK